MSLSSSSLSPGLCDPPGVGPASSIPENRERNPSGELPKKIVVTPEERRRLVKAGRKLGSAIKGLISIVTPATFMSWLNAEEKK